MSAISRQSENYTCNSFATVAVGDLDVCSADTVRAECGAIPGSSANQRQGGWGGARANSGGPRANSGGARPGAGRKPRPVVVTEPIGLRWYVVETYPQAERNVAHDLARQGWTHYLPLAAVRKRDPVLPTIFHKVLVPLFAGYLFVEFDRDSLTWGTIRDKCAGVRGIIRGGDGRPAPLGAGEVTKWKTGDAARLELASLAKPVRSVGTVLRVERGPFTSFDAKVVECDGFTTTVHVNVFGREVPVPMAWDDLTE